MSTYQPLQESELRRFIGIAQQLGKGRPAFGSGQRPADNAAGSGLEFKDYREYQWGEDSARIDWRASQRGNRTLTRQYRSELAASWVLCLDDSASMSVPSSAKWRLAAQVASAFAYLLLNGGHQVTFIRFSSQVDHYVAGATGHAQYLRILQQLRNQSPRSSGGGSSLRCINTLAPDSAHLAIFSDCLMPQGIQADLRSLGRPGRQLRLIQVLSEDETTLPGDDVLKLEDCESGNTQFSAPQQQTQAEARLDTLCQTLEKFCQRTQIMLTRSWTSNSWQQVLRLQYEAGVSA